MKNIYVASSWRNEYQPGVVKALRDAGNKVYDFKNPPKGTGFAWSKIDINWQTWSFSDYKKALQNPIAVKGFGSDWRGMAAADICVLVLPCGRSAHSEAGFMAGQGKPVITFIPEMIEPELMYRLFGWKWITDDLSEVVKMVAGIAIRLTNIKT